MSLGLAPVVIRDIYARLRTITDEGTTLIVVEQDINRALDASARSIASTRAGLADGPAADSTATQIAAAYFGM